MESSSQLNTLLAPRFLFRFAAPVRRKQPIWGPAGTRLDETYRLVDLAALDAQTANQEPSFADVRIAWDVEGIAWHLIVEGKAQPPWCHESRIEDSDPLVVWIDTRATHNIHRASKYCHSFAFLPTGGGRNSDQPLADQLLINRARENARPIRPRELQVTSRVNKTGYELSAFIPAVALGGYDPENHRSLGFTYAVIDRELGVSTFATGPAFPFDEDPSCWATLELVEA